MSLFFLWFLGIAGRELALGKRINVKWHFRRYRYVVFFLALFFFSCMLTTNFTLLSPGFQALVFIFCCAAVVVGVVVRFSMGLASYRWPCRWCHVVLFHFILLVDISYRRICAVSYHILLKVFRVRVKLEDRMGLELGLGLGSSAC